MAVVTGGVQAPVTFNQTPASGFLANVAQAIGMAMGVALKTGTAADQIDLIAVKAFSFTGTTPQTIDFTSLVDVYNNAVNLKRVKVFALVLGSQTDGQTLTLAPDATNGWTTGFLGASSTLVLQASSANNPTGGFFLVSAPNTTGFLVDATHKVLDLTPSATQTALLIAAGCSV